MLHVEKNISPCHCPNWQNFWMKKILKSLCRQRKRSDTLSHKSHGFTAHSKEELKRSHLCVREHKSLAHQDYALLLQEAWSHCIRNIGTSATCPNQLPFVPVTNATHAEPECLCTGIPEPGLLGLISEDGTIAKYGHLHRPFVSWQMAKDLLPSKLQKKGCHF